MKGVDFLSNLVLHRTYAHTKKDYTKENWSEVVDRIMDQHADKYKHVKEKEFWALFDITKTALKNKYILPSMRSAQFAGYAVGREPLRLFNCSFSAPIDAKDFADIAYLSMAGCGVGIRAIGDILFFTETGKNHYQVPDTREGWCEAVRHVMSNPSSSFDYSLVRKRGAPISTGGTASGPEVLDQGIEYIREIITNARKEPDGFWLTPQDRADILCFILQLVVCGGTRRSAGIVLFTEKDAKEFKKKEVVKDKPWRYYANVSAINLEDIEGAVTYALNNDGEPGGCKYSLEGTGTNPCGEISFDTPYGLCNLTEVNTAKVLEEDSERFMGYVCLATFLGTLQAGYYDYGYIKQAWRDNAKNNPLLGVSLTGVQQCWHKLTEKLQQGNLSTMLVDVNKEISELIGINSADRISCIKPSGSASAFLGCSSGAHGLESPYAIRRVRLEVDNPIYKAISCTEGYLDFIEHDEYDNHARYICIPCYWEGVEALTPKELARRANLLTDTWIKAGHTAGAYMHSVSLTITAEQSDIDQDLVRFVTKLGNWTVFPKSLGSYKHPVFDWMEQDRYEIEAEKFDKVFKDMDFDKLVYENISDHFLQESACSGGACEFR